MRARCCSHSTPGRIAAASVNARKRSAMTMRIFHSASATTTIEMTTIVTVAARRAVPVSSISRGIPYAKENEAAVIETHRHGIVLMRPLFRSLLLAAAGVACFFAPWQQAAVAGAALLTLAALLIVVAVARWDRTHLELNGKTLVVEYGFLRR